MNIKWGWWSFGLLLAIFIMIILLLLFELVGVGRLMSVLITYLSLFLYLLSFLFGIVALVKHKEEPKSSLIAGIVSLSIIIIISSVVIIVGVIFGTLW